MKTPPSSAKLLQAPSRPPPKNFSRQAVMAFGAAMLCSGGMRVCAQSVTGGPVINTDPSHWYYVLSAAGYTNSRVTAEGLGGFLVTINDAAENAWLNSTYSGAGNFWTGYWKPGSYQWLSGETPSYTNWSPGEPNNAGGTEFAAAMQSDGKWNDFADLTGGGFRGVVEVTVGPTTDALIHTTTLTMNTGQSVTSKSLTVGIGGSGGLNIASGGAFNTGLITLGSDAGGNGAVNILGTLSATRIVEGAGSGVINATGGILQARANESDFLSGFEAGDVRLLIGLAVDTNGFNIGINAPMSGVGGLTKLGAGTLTLGGANTYAQRTVVKTGTLTVGSGGSITHPSGAVTVADTSGDNGTLILNGGNVTSSTVVVAGGSGSTGAVNLTSGVLSTSQVLKGSGTGSVAFNGGTLRATASQSDFISGFEAGNVTINAGGAVIDSNGFAIGIGIPMGGTGALTKRGTETLTLTGSNTYSGGTTVKAGTLTVGSQGSVANGSAIVIVGDTNGDNASLVITGGVSRGNVTDGLGYIGNAQGATGSVTVTNGSWTHNQNLAVGFAGTGTMLVHGGSVSNVDSYLGLSATGVGIATVTTGGSWTNTGGMKVGDAGSGTLSVSYGLVNVTGTVFVASAAGSSGTVNLSGAILQRGVLATTRLVEGSGNGTVNFDGGTLRANSAQSDFVSGFEPGDVTINTGGANVDSNGFDIGINAVLGGPGGLLKLYDGTLTLGGSNTYSGGTRVGFRSGTLALTSNSNSPSFLIEQFAALELNVDTGTRSYGSATNVVTFTGEGSLVKTGLGTANWTGVSAVFAMDSGSLIDVQAGVLVGGSNGNEVWTDNKADLNVASGALFNGVEANVRVDALTGSGTIRSGFTGSLQTFTFGVDSGSGSFAGELANNAGLAANYIKAGTGTQTLTGTNTYTGTTTLAAGTLALGSAGALGTTGSILFAGGTLQFSAANGSDYSARFSTVASQPFRLDTNGQSVTLGTALASASGTLTKLGTGTLTLAASNTYTGNTTVKGGTLAVTVGGSLGVSNTIVSVGDASGDNGALLINGGSVSDGLGYLGNAAGAAGSATVTSGTWSHNQQLAVGFAGAGTLLVNGGTVSNVDSSLGLSATGVGTATVTSGTWTNSGGMKVGDSGAGTLNVSGGLVSVAGTVTLASVAASSGGVTLSGVSGNRGVLATSRVVEGSGNGTLTFDGGILRATAPQSDFISAFESGEVTTIAGGAFIDSNGFDIGISAALSGSGAFTKQGAGTLALSGAATYTGPTTVSGGTLAVNGSISGSTTTVNSGATLKGIGTLATVDIASGGTLAPGNSIGTITTGNFLMEEGAHLQLELGGTGAGQSDRIRTLGRPLLFGGDAQIILFGGYTPVIGDKFFIIVNDGFSSVFGSFSNDDAQQRITAANAIFTVNYADNFGASSDFNDVSLTVFSLVPEPGTAALLALVLPLLGWSRVRRELVHAQDHR